MAPGRLPHAQSFVPFAQSCGAGPAANAGCMLTAATMNNDARTIFFTCPSVPANRLVRAAFCGVSQKAARTKRFAGTEGQVKKIVLASLFIVAAVSMQPAFAAGPAPQLCAKGTKLCACGSLPGAMWNCCHAKAKCDCGSGLPNCSH